jgi:hypothetical protein
MRTAKEDAYHCLRTIVVKSWGRLLFLLSVRRDFFQICRGRLAWMTSLFSFRARKVVSTPSEYRCLSFPGPSISAINSRLSSSMRRKSHVLWSVGAQSVACHPAHARSPSEVGESSFAGSPHRGHTRCVGFPSERRTYFRWFTKRIAKSSRLPPSTIDQDVGIGRLRNELTA